MKKNNSGLDTATVCISIVLFFILGMWLFPPNLSSDKSFWDNFLDVIFWIIVFLLVVIYVLLQHKKIQGFISVKLHTSPAFFRTCYILIAFGLFAIAYINIGNLRSDEYKAKQHAEYEAEMESREAEEEMMQNVKEALEDPYIAGPDNATEYILDAEYQLDKVSVIFDSIDIYKDSYAARHAYFAVINCDIINNTEELVDWMLTSSFNYGSATINGIDCNLAEISDIPENLQTGDVLKRGTLNPHQKINGCFQVILSEMDSSDDIGKLRNDTPMDFSFFFYESHDMYEPHYELEFSLNKE